MSRSNFDNLYLATTSESVDRTNSRFYSRFPYPWRPKSFSFVEDPYFETKMLNQSIGDWEHRTIPDNPRIWIAGCGTNQAIYTALKFPKAKVLGSDISSKSLSLCADTAKQLGIKNLELKEENINTMGYRDSFDYILCTGVIHHTVNPENTLKNLAKALKPSGLIELMVYNHYHVLLQTTFQKAIRLLGRNRENENIDFDSELLLAKNLVKSSPEKNMMSDFLKDYIDCDESKFADELLQPVSYSYTIESLQNLALSSGLEITTPCIDIFDKVAGTYSWNMDFNDKNLQDRYDSLPDIDRWQISNLLKVENSPNLWVYLQRMDADRTRKTEKEICEDFLNTKFISNRTIYRVYLEKKNGEYELSGSRREHPSLPRNDVERKIVNLSDGTKNMSDIFKELNLMIDFRAINNYRLKLTTPAYPYLHSTE